jgi:hypothetical protein
MENELPKIYPAFFIPDAQSLDDALVTGQIFPFMDNINQILQPNFASTEYESVFIGNFADRVHAFDLSKWKPSYWNPADLKEATDEYRIYCTIGWTMHHLKHLMNQTNIESSMSYYLTLYTDMHIPLMIYLEDTMEKMEASFFKMKHITDEHLTTDFGEGAPIQKYLPSMDKVFHQGNLPDVLHYIVQCSFFSDTRSKANPIVHLLSKSLPQRCTIRNLREIVSNYCRKYEDVYQFVLGCLKCSLMGLYETCTERPPLDIRIKLFRKFNSISKAQMLQWMMRDHQQLLFYTIKEFLIYGVRQVPSMYEEIEQRYYWDKFEDCVMKAMNTVRKCVCMETNLMDFKGVELQLSVINKQQVHHLYRPTRHQFCHIVFTECEKIDDSRCANFITKEFPVEHKHLIYKMAIRIPNRKDIPYKWLEYFKVSKQTIRRLEQIQDVYIQEGSKSSLKSFLTKLSRYEFEAVRDFSAIFDRKTNCRLFTLPVHIYKRQYVALRRKHGIPNNVELPEDVGYTMMCLQCRQFKGFVNTNDGKGKISNLYAFGHSKVLIDDESMKMYCGKRCDKVDGKKRHHHVAEYSSFMQMDSDVLKKVKYDRERKRSAKEVRKEIKNAICSDTELIRVNLLGVLLQFYNNLYTICPSCGNFMKMESKYFTKDSFYCGCCIQHGRLYTTVSCEWCHAVRGNESWCPIAIIDDTCEEEKERNIYLCQGCHKPWIRNARSQLKLSIIRKGLTERWKRLQHAVPT